MLDIPYNATCPKCKVNGIENFNMFVPIMIEQPLKYCRKLPGRISLRIKGALNGTWAFWDSPSAAIICKNCRYISNDYTVFEDTEVLEMKYASSNDVPFDADKLIGRILEEKQP